MARRATTKKAARKSVAKKAPRKAVAKKATRKSATKAVAKKATRKAPAKKRTRDPVGKATAAHLVTEKKLAIAKKAYDRAVVAEARAAEKLKTATDKLAAKSRKQQAANGRASSDEA
jgi:hypothetical protein